MRFNTLVGNSIGGYHGTDSGSPYRSGVYSDTYGNYISNADRSGALMQPRGGITMFWGNEMPSAGGNNQINIADFRAEGVSTAAGWGLAATGLNWITFSATPSSWPTNTVTLNAPAYQTNHTYAANSAVLNGSCNMLTVAGGTTGSSAPSCPSFGGTVTDSGGVVWKGAGGSTSTSSTGVAGWCAANPDTSCSSNAACSALSTGDTCSRYLDNNGGTYPYRDQSCVGHNQVVQGCYDWQNTGTGVPSTIFAPSPSTVIQQNRDYFDYVSSGFTGATGVGAGPLTAMPATCSTGVGYFATDQGSWNTSGNGFGNGVLYQCTTTNVWTPYYTPYAYPHPLETGNLASQTPPSPPSALTSFAQ